MFKKVFLFAIVSGMFLNAAALGPNPRKSTRKYYKRPIPIIAKLESNKIWGIDFSHHQVISDWEGLLYHKPNFVFIKASEGVTHCDARFDEYWETLEKNNVPKGAYHFFSYSSSSRDQANHFISHVKLKNGDLPPVLDLEFSRQMPPVSMVRQEVIEWINIIEEHYGVRPIIYVGPAFYTKYLSGLLKPGYHFWISDYRGKPSQEWTFWQSSKYFKVKGVKQFVDLNYFSGSKLEFESLLIKKTN